MEITSIGLDIEKSILHLFVINQVGRSVKKRPRKRAQLPRYFAQLGPCVIAMEACGGANYWARELIALGHEVNRMGADHHWARKPGHLPPAGGYMRAMTFPLT
ncbi:MAG: transposase [Gammaproteobacteria bacterium]|jgi:transposase